MKLQKLEQTKLEAENSKVQGILKLAQILISVTCKFPDNSFTTTEAATTEIVTTTQRSGHIFQHFQNAYFNCK